MLRGAGAALGEVLASGFRALNASPRCSEDDLRSSMEGAGRVVAHRLERYLSALATIASAAPLMGLFGTVVGMIEIFGSQPDEVTVSEMIEFISQNDEIKKL